MHNDSDADFTEQTPGIKYGISSGQWEHYIDLEQESVDDDDEEEKYTCVSSSSSVGRDEIEFLPISYSKDSFIRFVPGLSLKDLDEAIFLPMANKSLAEKVKAIHIYSNGYKLQEVGCSEFKVDNTEFEPNIPVEFSPNKLEDQWVRIRPEIASAFHIHFFDETPKRMFVPNQVVSSLDKRKK